MSARLTAINVLNVEEFLAAQPEAARKSARLAINQVARRSLPDLRRAMKEDVDFPAGYLESPDRFGTGAPATDDNLETSIVARFRPTSLARFAEGSMEGARRTGYVNVKVNRGGGAVRMQGAFFVKLRRGGDTSDGFNLGLAIRLKPGERLRGRKKGAAGVQLAPDLYLLYGPSVDQVFRETSVAESPRIADNLLKEFTRQYVRMSGEM